MNFIKSNVRKILENLQVKRVQKNKKTWYLKQDKVMNWSKVKYLKFDGNHFFFKCQNYIRMKLKVISSHLEIHV